MTPLVYKPAFETIQKAPLTFRPEYAVAAYVTLLGVLFWICRPLSAQYEPKWLAYTLVGIRRVRNLQPDQRRGIHRVSVQDGTCGYALGHHCIHLARYVGLVLNTLSPSPLGFERFDTIAYQSLDLLVKDGFADQCRVLVCQLLSNALDFRS